jgi:excisionase family DNA binding protein
MSILSLMSLTSNLKDLRMTEEKRYSTKDAAERLGVTQRTIQRWYDLGEFPNARPKSPFPRSPVEIPESDIEAFERRRDAANPAKQN